MVFYHQESRAFLPSELDASPWQVHTSPWIFWSQFLWSNDVKTIHMPQPTKRIAEQGNIRLAESKIRNHPEDLEKHPSLIWIDLV